ncbi:DUF2911 domain-containing protein [Nafulsella turpanensis]|uniref:DUF2911 domain-containing protein n=1 Tax=Nafulsella turpanensis TaxID=1265690 RepID=UPI00047666C2|nr:DUF2911 domain-containing protein [Nafulsella turpanensis]
MKKLFLKKWILLLALCGSMHLAQAQIEMPQASPPATLETTVGLTDVVVDYSRPGLKGRGKKIFGELIPYGEVWRTGANESTKVTFEDSVKIAGQSLPPGTYALYTIPGIGEWTVIFSNNTELWGDSGYNPEDDALRVKVKPTTIPYPVETFTIDFSNYTKNSADLNISWDNTMVSVPIETAVDDVVMAQIKELTKVSPNVFYQAARYYQENNKDLNQALQWINQAISGREHFVFYNVKSKILADMKNYKEAIKAAEKSKELAAKENNQDYVKINEELITRYKAMK